MLGVFVLSLLRWYFTFRAWLYTLYICLHQSLAVFFLYCLWAHLASKSWLSSVWLLIALLGVSLLSLICRIIIRNGALVYGLPRAEIHDSNEIMHIEVKLQRPLRVEAGQHVNVWFSMARVNPWSLVQSYPFVVASWSDKPQSSLALVVEPRRRLKRDLGTLTEGCRAVIDGPHGVSINVGEYDVVLMIASGCGIAAQLPYLLQLLHGYNGRRVRARRIHLVWVRETLGQFPRRCCTKAP